MNTDNSQASDNRTDFITDRIEPECQSLTKEELIEENKRLKNEIQILNQRIELMEKNETEYQNKQELDIVIMYSFPLVHNKKIPGSNYQMPCSVDYIDFETEICLIKDALAKIGRHVMMRVENARFKTLWSFLSMRPRIIHIICHGNFTEDISEKEKFYLAFENKKGELYELKSGELKAILEKLGNKKDEIGLVFVNACYSQNVSQFFIDAGIPCVISVNREDQIKDEIAKKFSEIFYQFIFEGFTVANAFEKSKDYVNTKFFYINQKLCCCSHHHSQLCPRNKMNCLCMCQYLKNNRKKADSLCGCNREVYSIHAQGCKLAKEFCKISGVQYNSEDKMINVCCCPTLHSKEGSKYTLRFRHDINEEEYALYKKGFIRGHLTDQSTWEPRNFKMDQFPIGRNYLIYTIFYELKRKKKLINVYGVGGIGKTLVSKHAMNYFLERDYSASAVEYKTSEVHIKDLDRDIGVCHNTKIFLLDDFDNLEQERKAQVLESIVSALRRYPKLIFVVLSRTEIAIQDKFFSNVNKSSILIDKLSTNHAERLLKMKNKNYESISLKSDFLNTILIPKDLILHSKKNEILLRIEDYQKPAPRVQVDLTNRKIRNTCIFLLYFHDEIELDDLDLIKKGKIMEPSQFKEKSNEFNPLDLDDSFFETSNGILKFNLKLEIKCYLCDSLRKSEEYRNWLIQKKIIKVSDSDPINFQQIMMDQGKHQASVRGGQQAEPSSITDSNLSNILEETKFRDTFMFLQDFHRINTGGRVGLNDSPKYNIEDPFEELRKDKTNTVLKDKIKGKIIDLLAVSEGYLNEAKGVRIKCTAFIALMCKQITYFLQESNYDIFDIDNLAATNLGFHSSSNTMGSIEIFQKMEIEEEAILKHFGISLNFPFRIVEHLEFKIFPNGLRDIISRYKNSLLKSLWEIKGLREDVFENQSYVKLIFYCLEIFAKCYPLFKADGNIDDAKYSTEMIMEICDKIQSHSKSISSRYQIVIKNFLKEIKNLKVETLEAKNKEKSSFYCLEISGKLYPLINSGELIEDAKCPPNICKEILNKIKEYSGLPEIQNLIKFLEELSAKGNMIKFLEGLDENLKKIKFLSKLNTAAIYLINKQASYELQEGERTVTELKKEKDLISFHPSQKNWVSLEINFLEASLLYEKSKKFKKWNDPEEKQQSLKSAKDIIWESLKMVEALDQRFSRFKALFNMIEKYIMRDTCDEDYTISSINRNIDELLEMSQLYKEKKLRTLQIKTNILLLEILSNYFLKDDEGGLEKNIVRSIDRIIQESKDALKENDSFIEEKGKFIADFNKLAENLKKKIEHSYKDRFIFMRASPLVFETHAFDKKFIQNRDFVHFDTLFKHKAMKAFKMFQSYLDFQILSHGNFETEFFKGGKLLHLNFEEYQGHIIFETAEGRANKIKFEDLFKNLRAALCQRKIEGATIGKLELLVLCVPNGKHLAENFTPFTHVSNVVYFNIDVKDKTFYFRNLIQAVCLKLYKKLRFSTNLKEIVDGLNESNLVKKLKQGFKFESNFIGLFNVESCNEFSFPKALDPLTKQKLVFNRDLCNVDSLRGTLFGRNTIISQLIQKIKTFEETKDPVRINLVGSKEVGKTTLVKALGYYLGSRCLTKWNIFYLDYRNMKKNESIIKSLIETIIRQYPGIEEFKSNFLYIFDNFDSFEEKDSYFDVFISEIFSGKFNFIILSQTNVEFPNKLDISSSYTHEPEVFLIERFVIPKECMAESIAVTNPIKEFVYNPDKFI